MAVGTAERGGTEENGALNGEGAGDKPIVVEGELHCRLKTLASSRGIALKALCDDWLRERLAREEGLTDGGKSGS